jgi:hypothetical protein
MFPNRDLWNVVNKGMKQLNVHDRKIIRQTRAKNRKKRPAR